MKKTISLEEAHSKLSDVVHAVLHQRDIYIISKQGRPAVAVVPLETLERWKEDRSALFQVIAEVQSQNKDMNPDEVQKVVMKRNKQYAKR